MTARKADLDHLLDMARMKLPGSSDAGLKGELYDVFHEFFNDSNAWMEDLTLNIIANTTTYDVVPSSGQIIRLAGVLDANGEPQPALMPSIGQVVLQNPPNQAQTFTATVVKNVAFPTDKHSIPDVPEWIIPLYTRTLLDGLLGKMYSQPNKTYSNPALGLKHEGKFATGVALVRVAVLRRNTIGSQAWSFPQSFRSNSQRGGISTADPTRF